MSCRPVHAGTARGQLAAGAFALALLLAVLPTALAVSEPGTLGTVAPAELEQAAGDHLVLSELVTGGVSASDEFVELYNPAPVALPIDGLELIYVTASGATITRKAAWPAGAPAVPPGGHVLIANEAGLYAAIADLTYVNGLAATGGSLALRMTSVASAIDAVGWGTAASTWLEGAPAPAPSAGHSLERLPGGAAGSTQDTDQNALDFVERDLPDPQNGGSTPVPPASPQPSGSIDPTAEPTASSTPSSTPVVTAIPDPTPTATFAPTPTPTTTPAPTSVATPTPAPQPLSIAEARALPDGSRATITGVSLTDGTFADGGGYVVDVSGGIAVLVSDGTFPRGVGLRVSGNLDDRYSQRTLRATAADVVVLGAGTDPPPLSAATGAIAEPVECRLVVISGAVASSPTTLSGGLGYDLDDGSGAVRVFVGTATGIDTSAWVRGATIMLTGVVGQRDTTGSGAAGYRVQPRDAVDIEAVAPPPTPSPTPTPDPSEAGSPTPSGSASASPEPSDPSIVPIADARRAATGTRLRVRGVVTLASGVSEPGSAVVQDGSGGILIRLGDEAGTLARGELVELVGTRSTKAGMASLRVSRPPLHLGRGAEPDALRRTTGGLGEAQEALLVVVRGAIGGKLLRTGAGNVYFDLDDGSGTTRVFLSPRAAIATDRLAVGAWIEVAGVLGQETTGQQPTRGYRLWPRDDADVTILAQPIATEAAAASGGPGAAAAAGGGGAPWPSGGAITLLTPPRLARAVPTASPVPHVVGPAGGTLPARESQPAAQAALLLLLAGLMVATAAGLAAEPGLLDRLRGASASEEIVDGGDGARIDPVGEAATPADPVRLVPLGVLDDTPPRTQTRRASRQDGGRILPPT